MSFCTLIFQIAQVSQELVLCIEDYAQEFYFFYEKGQGYHWEKVVGHVEIYEVGKNVYIQFLW